MEKSQSQSQYSLELKNIEFSYSKSSKNILNDFSLATKKGTIHGILGDNGAGKTTLFNLIFGFLKPKKGEIKIKKSKNIAFLQTENYFYPYTTGLEHLLLSVEFTNENQQVIHQRINDWNELFELPLQDFAQNYSTGMKRKLSLLSILLLDKEIIILDEPFNGLDLQTSEIVHLIIQKLKKTGKTILLSSHILETIVRHADEVSFLEKGKILHSYSKNEFKELNEFVNTHFGKNNQEKIDTLLK
ncbi:ATP-binding cassette domain-containing protein [Bernardetia sp. OM2101]|uniref:ATP-binding cassette domain-containing protein n=1 Tax=Bernardetia sp. OM2101 TaxID=3344876 RepID=UPI0035CF39E1